MLVLRLTDSGVALGVQSALLFLPVLLFGVLGGTFADRFDKRRILLWATSATPCSRAPVRARRHGCRADVDGLFGISALNGLRVEPPTRQSFCGARRRAAHHERRQSQQRGVHGHLRVLGGAIAGTMIQAFGLWSPFFLDAVSYVAVMALLAMRVDELHLHRRAEREPGLAGGSGTCSARPSSGSCCS